MPSPETWVAIGFIVFLCALAWLGAYRKLVDGLDARHARIQAELDEANQLREEARLLLADIERNALSARSEADGIMAAAKAEIGRLADEAQSRIDDFIARRKKMADAKIAYARTRAQADVRDAVVDAAVAAATGILGHSTTGDLKSSVVGRSVDDVRTQLNGVRSKTRYRAVEYRRAE